MSRWKFFTDNSVRGLLRHVGIVTGILLFSALLYFYIYLPNRTLHGDKVKVPDLHGAKVEDIDKILKPLHLRFVVSDSTYTDTLPPLAVVRQFPQPDFIVKPDRMIYLSLNRKSAPTMPMPDLIDGSLVNARTVLASNELKLGKIFYTADPFRVVKEMRFQGKTILAGERLPKGSVVDLFVGDGMGPADYVVGNLVGDTYAVALKKLLAWNLHLGDVQIMEGADTTGTVPFVFKQFPASGDSVRVGDPISLWLAPKGYQVPEENNQQPNP